VKAAWMRNATRAGALATGFFSLGLALGQVAGFSDARGISVTLLSSIFSFVGGSLLTFGGFQLPGTGAKWGLEPVRVGTSLACFSLGILLGTPAGVYERCNRSFQSFLLGSRVEESPCLAPRARSLRPDPSPTPRAASADEAQTAPDQREVAPRSRASLQNDDLPSPCAITSSELQASLGDDQLPAEQLRLQLARLLSRCRLSNDCDRAYEQLYADLGAQPRSAAALRDQLDHLSDLCRLDARGNESQP